MPKIVDWYMDGKINIDDLVSEIMPIDRVNDAFDAMQTTFGHTRQQRCEHRLDQHARGQQFAVQAIPSDVGCTQCYPLQQGSTDVRLAFPYIEHGMHVFTVQQ